MIGHEWVFWFVRHKENNFINEVFPYYVRVCFSSMATKISPTAKCSSRILPLPYQEVESMSPTHPPTLNLGELVAAWINTV